MKQKVTVIITAAGTGSRFTADSAGAKPKQYMSLLGKPVILHSLLVINKSKLVSGITVSAETGYFGVLHTLREKNRILKLNRLIEGGKTRFHSVRNAFREISGCDLVLVHDAARPNITTQFIDRLINHALEYGNTIPGLKVSDTVKLCRNEIVKETVNRENLWLVQTPQVFRYNDLLKAYSKCGNKTYFTDEASLIEFAGYKVNICEGLRNNIKITTPEDLAVLKKLMK